MNHQKGFLNIIVIIIAVVVLAGAVGHFTLVQKTPEIAQHTDTPTPPSNQTTTTPKTTTETTWLTFSDNSHISFQYPSDWKVGKFEHNPSDYNLQPIDHFTAESKNNNIFISITGHCMNTQCLTVYSLDDMVREFGAKIISTAKAKNATGYKVKFSTGNTGYMFIKSKDLITMSTDIYPTYMDRIIPTLKILASEENLLRACSTGWFYNKNGIYINGKLVYEYFLINGQKVSTAGYDIDWVKANCKINQPEEDIAVPPAS